jgi:hypothetical protein
METPRWSILRMITIRGMPSPKANSITAAWFFWVREYEVLSVGVDLRPSEVKTTSDVVEGMSPMVIR